MRISGILVLSLGVFLSMGMMTNPGSMMAYGAKYSQHSMSQTNYCGNGFLSTAVNCGNDQAAIQGDHNEVVTTSSGITPSSSSSPDHISDRGYLDEAHGDGNYGDENGLSRSTQTHSENHRSGNLLSSNDDPTARVFPCCDEMPESTII